MTRHFGHVNNYRANDAKAAIVFSGILVVVFSGLALYLLRPGGEVAPAVDTVVVEREAKLDMVDVIVPVKNIDAGTPLEPSLFRKVPQARTGISDKVVTNFEELKGVYARSMIVAEQPLYRDYITAIRPTNAVIANIPEGFRAVTIRVDAQSSVEGWARPGARVDVVWTSKIRGKSGIAVIVENAKVLSAERQAEVSPGAGGAAQPAGAPVPSTVTLLVTSEDAKRVQLAATAGSMALALRGDRDAKSSSGGPLTVDDLLAQGVPVDPKKKSSQGTIKIKGENGEYNEFAMRDGKLVPLEY